MFYENGNPQRVLTVKQGVPNGGWKEYYENGHIKASLNTVNGKKAGLVENYYPNGKLASKIQFYNDLPNGMSIYYDEDGNHIRTVNMVNGAADPNGKIRDSYLDVTTNEMGFAVVDKQTYLNGNFMEYMMVNGVIDYSRIDYFDSNEKLIGSYNSPEAFLAVLNPHKEVRQPNYSELFNLVSEDKTWSLINVTFDLLSK